MAEQLLDLYSTPPAENPVWISDGILPRGGILLIGGYAKVGKSFLLLDLIHGLATGSKVWGHFTVPEPTTVLYLDFEIGKVALQQRVKWRYDTLKTPPPKGMYYLSRPKQMFLDTAGGASALAREIEETGAKVVVVDPLSRCMLGQENDAADVGRLFRHLDELLASYEDLSFVLSHHLGKPPKEDALLDEFSPYRLRGSSRFFDCPDAIAIVHKGMLASPGELWRLKIGFELRQAASPPALKLAVMDGGLIQPVKSSRLPQSVSKEVNHQEQKRPAQKQDQKYDIDEKSDPVPHVRNFITPWSAGTSLQAAKSRALLGNLPRKSPPEQVS
ncbi:MAG TPA: AAA family ATPase [Candidatus Hydrogenedentes bacterium]|nr:AAA family ATPase [Candidatus Hydrogenedentota bacterium]